MPTLLYDANTSKNPDFPYECYGKFDLNEMDDSECLAAFRFHKSDVPVLFEALQLPQSFTCQQGTICDGIEGLCLTLRTSRFAYPCRYSDLIPRFGRPFPEISMISNLVMDTIYQEHNQRITTSSTSRNIRSCNTSKRESITQLLWFYRWNSEANLSA